MTDEMQIQQIPFAYNLPSGRMVRIAEKSPLTGYIKEINIAFHEGCNGLVDVRIECDGRQIFPTSGYGRRYLALNSAIPKYRLNEPVKAGRVLLVEIGNADNSSAHQVTILLDVEGTGYVASEASTITPETTTYETRGTGKPDYSQEVSSGRERRGLRLAYRQTLEIFGIVFTAETSGVHTAAISATVMTDATANFTVDALISGIISNVTDGSTGIIVDNDGTTVTVLALTGGLTNQWNPGDLYYIPSPFAWVTTPLAIGGRAHFIDTATGLALPYTILAGYTLTLIAAGWGFTEDAITWVYLDGLLAVGGVMTGGQTEYENKIIGISSATADPTGAMSHTFDLQVVNQGGGVLEGSTEWNLLLEAVGTPPLPSTKEIKCRYCGQKTTVPVEQVALICPRCKGLTKVRNLRQFRETP